MHLYRTHNCGELGREHDQQEVRLSGWMHRVRDHGGVLFVDLRDHYGITQCVVDQSSPLLMQLEALRLESVITITGRVRIRDVEAVNISMKTGEIEVYIDALNIESCAEVLPLQVAGDEVSGDEHRLKYRYLDLRREKPHANIMLRNRVIASLRNRMIALGFTEFQTPILTASSPEGARDFLVPARQHPGKFYALPQAPQQFKQLLMMSGFDRYFQIAPCFRDEDSRADRSPGEFYQLDLEMAFVTQEDVFDALEPVLHGLFEEFAEERSVSPRPFRRIPYREAMLKYGSDKPDLRNPIEIQEVTEHFSKGGFGIFAKMIAEGAVVRAIPVRGGGSRAFCDRMDSWAKKEEKKPGLAYIFWRDVEGTCAGAGPVAKNLGSTAVEALRAQLGLVSGDAVFFSCDREESAAKFAGVVRERVGRELGLIDPNRFEFCWIVDFPMFERDEDSGAIDFSHNPFSMPQGGLEALENQDPLEILAYQYDIVCNGIELSSGAIRNHLPELMYKAFAIAGHDRAFVNAQFGGMISAMRYGAPPHGGSAPGVDRIVMLLANEPNIREVIAFPLNQRAEDPMMGAPSEVNPEQLEELNICVKNPIKVES